MKTLLFLFCFTVPHSLFSQSIPVLDGYVSWKNIDGQTEGLKGDFNGDGKLDSLTVLAARSDEWDRVVAIQFAGDKRTYSFPFAPNGYAFKFQKSILHVSGCFGNGRYCEALNFRFDRALNTLRLIGYEEESFGNAANEGAYVKSVNLMTGYFEISTKKVRKKFSAPVITLKNVSDERLEKLRALGREN